MPNLGDMTPEEKRNYLQFLKDMATQQANEGLRGMVSDAQAMEQEYARNRPDPAAMESAMGTDTAKSHMNMLMAALNAGNGNQGAAQVYGRAAGENPEQDALKNKQGAFMDYLKGLSGLKAQKNALSLPFLQKREAEASEALQGFDQQQAQAQQREKELEFKKEEGALSREQKAMHDKLWGAVMSGQLSRQAAQDEFNRWLATQTLDLKTKALELKGAGSGKPLPTQAINDLAEIEAAQAQIEALSSLWDQKASGIGASVSGKIPNTAANEFENQVDAYVQSIGKPLEGGKMTDQDFPRYKNMMPAANDTKKQKEAKISGLRKLADIKRKSIEKKYSEQGYNVLGSGNKDGGQPMAQPSLDKDARISALKAKGMTEEEINLLIEAGDL